MPFGTETDKAEDKPGTCRRALNIELEAGCQGNHASRRYADVVRITQVVPLYAETIRVIIVVPPTGRRRVCRYEPPTVHRILQVTNGQEVMYERVHIEPAICKRYRASYRAAQVIVDRGWHRRVKVVKVV